MFVQDKAETLIGRDKELQVLLGYSSGTPEATLEKIGMGIFEQNKKIFFFQMTFAVLIVFRRKFSKDVCCLQNIGCLWTLKKNLQFGQ